MSRQPNWAELIERFQGRGWAEIANMGVFAFGLTAFLAQRRRLQFKFEGELSVTGHTSPDSSARSAFRA